jgi:glycosyltransferase involved in cell wall biosynthesis
LPMKIKISFFWILNVFTARYCIGFLSNSESIKNSNCKALFIPREKVKVIYRGRRPNVFSFSSERFKQQKIKFLCIGRLLYRKGHEELIRAFYKFQKQIPNSKLAIAGEGPFRARLEQLIKQLDLGDKVVLLGNVRDTSSHMKAYDIFVFPSHYEGFSGTIVEAMFSGIPILASDIDMNKEAIIHNETGRLFKVKDVDAIVNEMTWACEHIDQITLMSAKARKVAEKRFDIDTIVRQHENYYRDVLAKCATV